MIHLLYTSLDATLPLHACGSMQSGPDERSIPGNTVAVQADMPFGGLTTFGTSFLSKFECSQMPHPVSNLLGTKTIESSSFLAHI